MNAFVYLVWMSARNRFLSVFRRARSPRYAAALIVGGLYVWSFLLRPTSGPSPLSFLLGRPTEMLVTLIAVITLMGSWVFGSDSTALAFTQAEVSILFPAPISRRGLIGYKLFRAQISVLINALIWVFVLRRGGTTLAAPLRAVALWVLFSTLNLHRLGAALVRSSWREHGKIAVRRHRGSIVAFGVIGALIVAGVIEGRAQLTMAGGPRVFMAGLAQVLAAPPAYWGLFVFHLVVAPTFTRSAADWARAIWPALAVLLAHAWWVLRTDAAFEDAAIDASTERARRIAATRARRSLGAASVPRTATSTLHLGSSGHPAIGIFWKNMLCLRRTAQLRVFIAPVVMAVILGVTIADGADAAASLAAGAMVLAGMLVLFGGRLIRNDLRQDMLHLPLIKTLPISPGDIVLAEVASAALPMAAVQMLLVIVAYAALLVSRADPIAADVRVALLLATPFAVVALNGALITIQNGMAVLFPVWVRLGPMVTTGVEALGQNVLATMATLLALALALVIPLAGAWGLVHLLGEPPAASLALIVILAAIVLAAETYAAMRVLGRALARAEPIENRL